LWYNHQIVIIRTAQRYLTDPSLLDITTQLRYTKNTNKALTKPIVAQNLHNKLMLEKMHGEPEEQAERRVLLPSTREPDPGNAGGGIAITI